ncbi:MAG: hypothetical protein IJE68_04970 [Clostridia bacterium]|nr:hypothetical protein [Clostridia bacterium]
MSSNDMLVQILKIVNDLKDEVKENRREIQKSREIEESHWQENLRRWKENDKRWEENDKRWEENEKRWEKYESNRKADRKFLLDTLIDYDLAISKQLKDKNAEKMKKIV